MGKLETTSVSIGALAERVRDRGLELPEIQRSFVWNRPQVRDLLDSLYRGFPIGTLLFWRAGDLEYSRDIESDAAQGSNKRNPDFVLDGQQRLTALSKVIHGGDPDIRFHIETEQFEVANAAIKRDPHWIPAHDVFAKGAISVAKDRGLFADEAAEEMLGRLNRLEQIKNTTVPIHILDGFDYDEVTEIFVRVNSKGTRLRQAELAIARLAFRLPGMVTNDLKTFEEELDGKGYDVDLRYLVRCLTAVATGQSRFRALGTAEPKAIESAWAETRKALQYFLNLARENLGLESWDWVPSNNALIVPVAYLARRPYADVDQMRLLRWFLLSSVWQRYSGSAETAMDADLRLLKESDPFDALEHVLKQEVGRLEVTADDLDDAGVRSPFFLAAYLACRMNGARDWATGVALSSTNLGTQHLLELHHVFPHALIADRYSRKDVNEIANIAFISKTANLHISKTPPTEYLPDIPRERLEQQFVPTDPALWEIDAYQDFLQRRRELLAEGINQVLTPGA